MNKSTGKNQNVEHQEIGIENEPWYCDLTTFWETKENQGNYVACDDCKNYKKCKSFWRGSVNSLNCEIEYGLFEDGGNE